MLLGDFRRADGVVQEPNDPQQAVSAASQIRPSLKGADHLRPHQEDGEGASHHKIVREPHILRRSCTSFLQAAAARSPRSQSVCSVADAKTNCVKRVIGIAKSYHLKQLAHLVFVNQAKRQVSGWHIRGLQEFSDTTID